MHCRVTLYSETHCRVDTDDDGSDTSLCRRLVLALRIAGGGGKFTWRCKNVYQAHIIRPRNVLAARECCSLIRQFHMR